MQIGTADRVFDGPHHPIPRHCFPRFPTSAGGRSSGSGSPAKSRAPSIPLGLRVPDRCPRKIGAICEQQEPPLVEHAPARASAATSRSTSWPGCSREIDVVVSQSGGQWTSTKRRSGASPATRAASPARTRLCGVILFDPINIRYATGSRNMQVWTMHNPVATSLSRPRDRSSCSNSAAPDILPAVSRRSMKSARLGLGLHDCRRPQRGDGRQVGR